MNTMRDVIDLKRDNPKDTAEVQPVAEDAVSSGPVETEEESRSEQAVMETSDAISEEEITRITTDVIKALKTVYDPEIPVDIYELGLIYKVDLDDDKNLKVDKTLTAPGCPVAGEMPGWVEGALRTVSGINDVSVDMTFDPPWTPEKMSDEARLELGWM